MIRHWFTRGDAPLTSTHVKRFDPRHFTVDFPRGAIASAVVGESPNSLEVQAEFLRPSDLVGLIYKSDDGDMHPCLRREHDRDYRNCQLSFRWRSEGLPGLDDPSGAVLTIEGRTAAGLAKTWYVRLWNYAAGTPTDAVITLDFNDLAGGYSLPANADPVHAADIDRMFFSVVSSDYAADEHAPFADIRRGTLTLSEMKCDGSRSVLKMADAMVPEHPLRICTAYDDLYHLVPERIIELIEHLGYRKLINHYVGMSHHQGLSAEGLIDPTRPLNSASTAWHQSFYRAAHAAGYEIISSLSFEILDSICPADWKQRTADGAAAQTGYVPPSTLVSPANAAAVGYLAASAEALAAIARSVGAAVQVQIGEPWWWVTAEGAPCLYDAAARAALGGHPVEIADVAGSKSEQQLALLDQAGELLAGATATICSRVRAVASDARLLLLVYTPSILAANRSDWYRANLPAAWQFPAFDVLQIEDYEWLTAGREAVAEHALAFVTARLGYQLSDQHYLAGYAISGSASSDWKEIADGGRAAISRGVGEVLVWALPQVMRDGVTFFDDGALPMNGFEDVAFPIEIGAEASVTPGFSTNVLTSASGHEYRNANWSQGRLRFDAGPGVRGDEELKRLIAFFRARRGSAQAFRFRDPYDHSSNDMTSLPTPTGQTIGIGDGNRTRFQLRKTYSTGEERWITRPQVGTVVVAVDGVVRADDWQLVDLGVVRFDEPPEAGAIVSAGYLFDVPVRFGSDQLEINRASFLAGDAPSVPLIEVREVTE